MKELEKILKALANHRRLMILKLLKENKELTVGDISEKIKLSFKSTSRHLSVLLSAEMVQREQRKIEMYYSLNSMQKPVSKYIVSII